MLPGGLGLSAQPLSVGGWPVLYLKVAGHVSPRPVLLPLRRRLARATGAEAMMRAVGADSATGSQPAGVTTAVIDVKQHAGLGEVPRDPGHSTRRPLRQKVSSCSSRKERPATSS